MDNDSSSHHVSSDSRPLKPFVALTPEACAEIVRALDRGVEKFREWEVSLPSGSWLQEARSVLVKAAESGSLGETDEELRTISAAAAAAIDLYHISTCLGDKSFRMVAVELGHLTHGRLLARSEDSSARNYLSQFWVGALLAQSKLNPRILAHDIPGKMKPDFIIECGRVNFAVEVKRPRRRDSAYRNVLRAGDQLRQFDRPGIIVIDATDCMSADPWAVTRGGPSVPEQARKELAELHHDLDLLVSSYSRSNKFYQTTMLVTFARYWPWIVDDQPHRDAGLNFHMSPFSYLWSHQITALTKEIQLSLLRGVEQLTGNPPSYQFLDPHSRRSNSR